MKFVFGVCTFSIVVALCACAAVRPGASPTLPSHTAIDAEVTRVMASSQAKGLALAVIEKGKPVYVKSYGVRNTAGDPLDTNTIMYGASLTKAVFAYTVMQLVDEGMIQLDVPIDRYLPKPLPDYKEPDVEHLYARWSALAGDDRWRKLTARILLTHSSGFANFGFLEPDGNLRFHFEPGTRYAYSGDGIILLQFVLERGLGLNLGKEMQRRVFDRFGMRNTSMNWRSDFRHNLADGWDLQGKVEPHDERSAVRAAGSMDTTVEDFARFAAGFIRGEGLSPASRAEITRPQLAITTRTQFPTLQPELLVSDRRADLAAGLGVITFMGPQGAAFEKDGHNDTTGNSWVCVEARRSCVVLLSNDVRAESFFPELVHFILGETGAPYAWTKGLP